MRAWRSSTSAASRRPRPSRERLPTKPSTWSASAATRWEYLYFVDELLRLLDGTPLVAGGSVITADDARMLLGKGVAAVFGPSATVDAMVPTIRDLAERRRRSDVA
jgi:hypothetical protein